MAHLLYENADGFESVQEWTNILSGGEAQRIGFARLFFHHPKMAFMDVRTTQPQHVASHCWQLRRGRRRRQGLVGWGRRHGVTRHAPRHSTPRLRLFRFRVRPRAQESTSALDEAIEEKLMRSCKDRGIATVSVGHRPSLIRYHDSILRLDGRGGFEMER